MQSGYGVSEIQQFMVDGGCPPLFSISAADIHNTTSQPHKHHHHHHAHLHQQPPQQLQQQQQYHQHLHLYHHQQQLHPEQQPPPPQPQPQRFHHFHSIPITQQLFQPTHQLHMFHQEQQRRIQQQQQQVYLGLDQESGQENSSSPTPIITGGCGGGGGGGGGAPFLGSVNFKLAVSESSGGGCSQDGLNDEEGIIQEDDGSESPIHRWPREEESAIKEPFWRPLDIDYINRSNKRCKEKQLEPSNNSSKHCKKSREGDENEDGNNSSASNYKLFSELEAICKPSGGGGVEGNNHHHQTRSGSALTGENPPTMQTAALGSDGHPNPETADHGSVDTSTGEEAAPIKKYQHGGGGGGIKSKRKRKQQLSSIASFFESLVRQLMEHQEGLHRKFLEVLERRDKERTDREESWRQHEAAKSGREAAARAQEQALASTREAAIISFLEKITGESLNLPTKAQFQSQFLEEELSPNTINADANKTNNNLLLNTNRWPKAEVQALIRVRSSFESRFQEPGLKGTLWEEVSSAMASMGYHRSAKRCKEKWENINKYFRKTKDSVKKRSSQQSKTCPYFHQLDQLYSNKTPSLTAIAATATTTSPAAGSATTTTRQPRDNSELLDAIVVSTDHQPTTTSFQFLEMMGSSTRLDFSTAGKDDGDNNNEASGSATAGLGLLRLRGRETGNEDDDEDEDVGDEEEGGEDGEGDELEGEGESQLEPAAY